MDRPADGAPDGMRVNGPGVNSAWPEAPPASGPMRWYHKAAALLYVFFCFEVGVFLLLAPWMREMWDHNFFSVLGPKWHQVWTSPYVRGAVSGLGLVNIGISFSELFRLRRFSSRRARPIE